MSFLPNKRKKEEIESDGEENKVDLEKLKKEFKDLYRQITDEDDKIDFISFVCQHLNVTVEPIKPPKEESKQDIRLQTIIRDLKDILPITSEAPNEKIIIPKNVSFEGYTKENTINVDGFLYTEEDVDELIDAGELKNNYCSDCGSKSIIPTNFVSHSTTPNQIKYMFSENVLGDLKDKVVLDIGSRLGSLLYTGYLFSDAKELIGIEINEYFSKLQKDFISKYKMGDRVSVIHGDILKHKEILAKSDVIYMNNVLEFFQEDKKKHIEFWEYIQANTKSKKGMKILTIPSIEETFKNNKIPLKLKGWLKKVPLDSPVPEDDRTFEDYKEIHLYTVV
ncbi:hypothetical protein DICPUDRAFT_75483 [Dictyostelium purpureum]|uniref:DOT1 domain-containing protein n=1 Tax=Dictyostelium purpureum TaxID=5786 RepID=F0ZAS6_DICPU|nr:uncharacterized protein DICPUDRAFT_75483 [Dictyostelium purpureum]EGC38937.1 hypothetical protein DICPUDRAFT_75483 [Dictyostelium purpureum]|eukprot:XP_003284502.1 hypothetical protein DICPUDRAFT_75483 [Dictyostelium purpureum]